MTVIKICSDCLLKNVYSHLIDDFENDAGECAICGESVEKRLTIAPNTKLGKYIHAVSEFYYTFLDHITQQPSSLSAISSQIFSASVIGKQIPKKIYDILRSNIGGTVSVFSDFQNGASPYSHSPPTAMSKVYYGFPRLRSEILDEYKKYQNTLKIILIHKKYSGQELGHAQTETTFMTRPSHLKRMKLELLQAIYQRTGG